MKLSTYNIPGQILSTYGINEAGWHIIPFGSGLINRTWKLEKDGNAFVLQRINQQVFRKPDDIAHNMSLLADYLKNHYPDYLFVAALPTHSGGTLAYEAGDGYYRLFPFVKGSRTIDVVGTPDQAFEAARQFGLFTRLLEGLDVKQLRTTIPSFHDITLRYRQFLRAVETGQRDRIQSAQSLIQKLIGYSEIVNRFETIRHDPQFRLRVIHHDTKISNVLFDNKDTGITVIDLDTVMPGYFISDLGDMMRTYLCPVSEEEKDVEKIVVRKDFYRAIMEGYLGEMKSVLSKSELHHLFYSGQFMIYMQAIRFLTDHLLGDTYYGAAYSGHNFQRARNQFTLLERLSEKESTWS